MKVNLLIILLAVCAVAAMYNKMPMPSGVGKNSLFAKVSQPELLLKVKDAKDTIEKLETTNLSSVMKGARDRANSTLEGVFDSKYDNYKDIDQTRAGVEAFVGRR